ncbi:MAG: GNAT family N-acetyltransferase [Egibacteraceae bacterium]
MSGIRPLERRDLARVASLFEHVMGSGSRTAPPGLEGCLARLLDHPWADPDIPSLVFEGEQGRIVGFVGSHVRRLCVDGRPVRAAYEGQLMSDPTVRDRGVGGLLLRRYLAGPQDVTITDSALAGEVGTLWERLGGNESSLGSLTWVRFFRPFRFGGDHLLGREKPGWSRRVRPLSSALDALATSRLLKPQEPSTRSELLTPLALLEHVASIAATAPVRVDYDAAFLAWAFRVMEGPTRGGRLVRRLVREDSGRALGWYVAYLFPGGIGEVQQLAGRPKDIPAVLDHLLHDAWRGGVAVLRGRLEPHLFEAVCARRCLIRPSSRFLVHSRDQRLLDVIMAGDGLLTRMDGDYWMGLHLNAYS